MITVSFRALQVSTLNKGVLPKGDRFSFRLPSKHRSTKIKVKAETRVDFIDRTFKRIDVVGSVIGKLNLVQIGNLGT